MDVKPFITVILPVLNEEKFIEKSLNSIIAQTISKEFLEVLVIDGNSSDSTPEIINLYSQKYNYIKLLKNPDQNTIAALNLGIKKALGDFIIRVDGHTYLEKDYIENCIEVLNRTDADNVGGAMRPIGNTYIQKAIAFATCSIFGIGPGKFHYSKKEEYVDTVYLGAFRNKLFEEIGAFDPEMHYNEDNEINLRIIRKGGKILLSPKIKSFYFPRDSIHELWNQYFNYGFFKIKVIQKHKLTSSLRHFVPAFFLSTLFVSAILSLFNQAFLYLFYLLVGSYFAATILFSLKISLSNGLQYFFVMPFVFATLHLSYGIGFLKGLLILYLFNRIDHNGRRDN